jgi:hypothetical protein
MLDTPSLVPTAENIKLCSLFYASRSFGDAAENSASALDVVLYPGRCVDDFPIRRLTDSERAYQIGGRVSRAVRKKKQGSYAY